MTYVVEELGKLLRIISNVYTQKIAIICAHPAGTNLGMISVDAATQSLEKHFDNVEFIRYCSWRSLSKGDTLNYLHYSDPDQLTEFDYIIFWGDFLHWIGYATADWLVKSRSMNLNISDEAIIDLWYSLYLLEGREDLQKKSILFGGTIYGLNSSQLSDSRYKKSLTSLIRNAILVKTRDILSANFVTQLVPEKQNVYGCDCSLLLDHSYFSSDIKIEKQVKYFLYSFARSGNKRELEQFVKSVEDTTALTGIYIPWIEKGACISSLERSIKIIQDAEFVLTDIYHLSLNSWREGVPAICIGNGNSVVVNSLSDKKKEIFYQQIFASNYFLFVEEIITNHTSAINKLKLAIDDAVSREIVVNYLKIHTQTTLTDLISVLKT
jgi:hypothetical protein